MTFRAHRYKVEGTHPFPVDMLRYDTSYPASELDAAEITILPDHRDKVTVTLEHIDDRKIWQPTYRRWESFGWKVTEVEAQ